MYLYQVFHQKTIYKRFKYNYYQRKRTKDQLLRIIIIIKKQAIKLRLCANRAELETAKIVKRATVECYYLGSNACLLIKDMTCDFVKNV
jgi:hypothetical protein